MTRKSILIAVGIGTAFIALAVLAVADYYPYYRANQQLEKLIRDDFADRFDPKGASMAAAIEESRLLDTCRALGSPQTEHPSKDQRDCWLKTMPKLSTMMIRLAVAGVWTPKWLREHPDDIELKAAALDAVAKAKTQIEYMQPYYDKLAEVGWAGQRSHIARALAGGPSGFGSEITTGQQWVDSAIRAEYAIRLPELTSELQDWKKMTDPFSRRIGSY